MPSDPMEKVAQSILKVSNADLRATYARALAASIKLDHDHKKPQSPDDIHKVYGVAPIVQLRYRIVLHRRAAVRFLNSIGVDISQPVFDRRYNREEYDRQFSRSISKAGNRHIFTYAEVRHLVGHLVEIRVPAQLRNLL